MKPQQSSEQRVQCLRSQAPPEAQLQKLPVVPTSSPGWGQSHPCHCQPLVGPCTFHLILRTFFAFSLGVRKSKTKLLILKYLGMWIFHDSGVSEGSKPGDGSLGPLSLWEMDHRCFPAYSDPKVTVNSKLNWNWDISDFQSQPWVFSHTTLPKVRLSLDLDKPSLLLHKTIRKSFAIWV